MSTGMQQIAPNPTAADTLSTSSTKSTGQTLGKDDFLKLMVGQLQNQDPMQPTDDSQWVAQMAQFTELEQTTNTASSTAAIATTLNRSGTLALIGRTVTYADSNGNPATGTVQQVDIAKDGTSTLTVGSTAGIDAGSVTEVQ